MRLKDFIIHLKVAEGCICWEAYDENGCGFAHSRSLSLTKILIDEELEGITTK